jgi:hypothetical protein
MVLLPVPGWRFGCRLRIRTKVNNIKFWLSEKSKSGNRRYR